MKDTTRRRKRAILGMKTIYGSSALMDQMYRLLAQGKQGFDACLKDLGRMMAETIMYIEREEMAGPDYQPLYPAIRKWASQKGSVYIGDQKIPVAHPRLRGPQGEIELNSYKKLKEREGFSEELLDKVLRGMSCRKYGETVVETAKAFGVSASSVSRHIIEATGKQLQEFKERSLNTFAPFAIFLDTVHRGGEAFIVGLGINLAGEKLALGFWQGATDNHEICADLLADMERRGLALSRKIIWITDGGKGTIKVLKERYGKKLIHQRCTIHKDRNIQRHLAKKYRKEAHYRFRTALDQNSYADARQMLLEMEQWLRRINESAADSLLEALEEILTLHRMRLPALLRKSLHSTNAIESLFSTVRDAEGNIKRYRDSRMMQRWLASVLLYCERGFRRIKGYASITEVVARIEDDNTACAMAA
jgi:transposase-like protein